MKATYYVLHNVIFNNATADIKGCFLLTSRLNKVYEIYYSAIYTY